MAGIIDFHSHYIPPEIARHTAFFKVQWSDIDRQLSAMDQLGIEKALLFYPATDAHQAMGGWANVCRIYNAQLSEAIKPHADRFIGAGIIPVDEPPLILPELERMQSLHLKVLSLASSYEGRFLDDEMFFPVYEFCQDKHMPIHVHPQILNPIGEERVRDPLLTPVLEYVFDVSICIGKMMMAGIFTRFSKVNFIFAHYGGVLPFVKERFDNTYAMLRGRNFVKDLGKMPSDFFKNLYFDTSGSKSLGAMTCALEVTDAHHILFGSDHPANQNTAAAIEMVRKAPMDERARESILRENALKILP